MMMTRSNLRRIGWAMILTVCSALLLALTFKVNAVKSQVRLTERQILALRQEKDILETEFETRANQRHLTALNDVEFGYAAPKPGQYLEGQRHLAMLGKARPANAPTPLMVASRSEIQDSALPAMVNPLTGRAMAAEAAEVRPRKSSGVVELGARLSKADRNNLTARKGVRE